MPGVHLPTWVLLVSFETFNYLSFLCLSFLSCSMRKTKLQPMFDHLWPPLPVSLSSSLLFLSLFVNFSHLNGSLIFLWMFLEILFLVAQSYIGSFLFLSPFLIVSSVFSINLSSLLNLTSLANAFPDASPSPTHIVYYFWAFCSFWENAWVLIIYKHERIIK